MMIAILVIRFYLNEVLAIFLLDILLL